jgi:hypothetical protein
VRAHKRESSLNPNYNTLERPIGHRMKACVIAQQHSSPAAVVSWNFHSRKEKFGAFLKKFTSIILPLKKNCLTL